MVRSHANVNILFECVYAVGSAVAQQHKPLISLAEHHTATGYALLHTSQLCFATDYMHHKAPQHTS